MCAFEIAWPATQFAAIGIVCMLVRCLYLCIFFLGLYKKDDGTQSTKKSNQQNKGNCIIFRVGSLGGGWGR